MMQGIPPEVLKKWPRLKKLQEEVSSLEKRHQEAQAKVAQLQAQVPAARDRDLDLEAQSLREGKGRPEPSHEPKVLQQLEGVQRDEAVLRRAYESAQGDLSKFVARHQGAIYEDVLKARADIAKEIAEHAKTIAPLFAKHCDLFYTLKQLAPAGPPVPQGSHLTIMGPVTTKSIGRDRGEVEQMLAYLAGLAGEKEEEQGAA